VSGKIARSLNGTKERLSGFFPTPDLSRKKWKELNATRDIAMFEGFRMKYGDAKLKTWVMDNEQKDLEES